MISTLSLIWITMESWTVLLIKTESLIRVLHITYRYFETLRNLESNRNFVFELYIKSIVLKSLISINKKWKVIKICQ